MSGNKGFSDRRGLILSVLTLLISVCSAQFFNNKPYPRYSLENMPRTSFSCRGKILGGYYADSETQCQMFHVCVKVAGVGVQDFRFLCPNSTAFDQEAQTCADWNDVDCEQATLYYGSDNFDLNRIGSGFESKRAPYADEEEATFHLQRAESSDARRSKLTVVNQSAGADKISLYNGQAANNFAAPQRTNNNNHVNHNHNHHQRVEAVPSKAPITIAKPVQNNFDNQQFNRGEPQKIVTKPALSTTTTTTTTSTTTTTTTRKPISRPSSDLNNFGQNQQQQSQQQPRKEEYNSNKDLDDIFKGSHSSNFFNNRHGKDDDYEDSVKTSYVPSTSTVRSNSRGRQRGRVNYKSSPNALEQNDYKQSVAPRQRGTTTTTTTTHRPPTSRPQPFQHQSPNNRAPAVQTPNQHFSSPAVDHHFNVHPTAPANKPNESSKLKIVVPDFKQPESVNNFDAKPAQHFFTNPSQSLHRQTIGNNGILPLSTTTTSTTEKPLFNRVKQDPFKITNNPSFINQQDQFNYQFNKEFQVNRQQPSTTTTSTTTIAPTFVRNTQADVQQTFKLNQNQFNHFSQQQQLAGQHTFNKAQSSDASSRGISFAQSQNQENQRNSYSANDPLTKLQLDNFNNLERTVQQLQKSVNKAYPTAGDKEPRTLLSSFAFAPSNPTTYNPHQFARTTQAPIVTSSPRGFSATVIAPQNVTQNLNRNSNQNLHIIDSTSRNSQTKFPSRSNENYTPSSVKRFSTLVPKDNYNPTTFKPGSYNKPIEGFAVSQFQQQLNNDQSQNSRFLNTINFSQPPSTTTTTTTTTTTAHPITTTFAPRTTPTTLATTQRVFVTTPKVFATTPRPAATTTTVPIGDIDEDDGQYHPELYEQDFAKNKLKRLRNQQQDGQSQVKVNTNFNNHNSNFGGNNFNHQNNNNNNNHHNQFQQNINYKPVPQSSSNSVTNSGEDEFLHSAHSQNIAAATLNDLRKSAAKAAAVSSLKTAPTTKTTNNNRQHQQQKTLSKAPTIPPNATSTRKPTTSADDKDASYDYAYYDSANENLHATDYSEYGIITDFGKTTSSQRQKKVNKTQQ